VYGETRVKAGGCAQANSVGSGGEVQRRFWT